VAAVFAFAPAFLARLARAEAPATHLRGRLRAGGKPVLELTDGRRAQLSGDESTRAVLNDDRLDQVDFEVLGHWESAERFAVDPFHQHAMFVHKDGKRLYVTYWCDVCFIRSYTPGLCWCCQKNTDLDLRDSIE
jgi:hypothetical protein